MIKNIVRETLIEQFDSPLHQQLRAKAEADKIDYAKELESYKKDHQEHLTIHERRELLGRVSLGLDLSKRQASDFEKKLKQLLDEYNL